MASSFRLPRSQLLATPDHLRFTWLRGERPEIADRRIPDTGTLQVRDPFVARVRVETVDDGERRVAIVRASASTGVYAEGVATIAPGAAPSSVNVVLRAGRLADADDDRIPDETTA